MRLVHNWRAFWRWHSTWALALIGVLSYLGPRGAGALLERWAARKP